ncbi:MAG: UDP-N-acetylmuramoyl-L-alanyl-D-glutamate--2,6-diaminopimelate ligase, partial [Verrucomicrobia bacterium]|nr:UDP-N-acetylmuramoyl-L-alanyl-D-glutamate--2,6-diaminopimelate ligase [Verrucomicrobiota bacterium]
SSGRVLLLFGCGGGRDEGKRHAMGRIAARLADRSWITNDNPRNENPESIVAQIVSGIQSVGGHSWSVEYDRRRAIENVLREATPNDVVLIAGKGHETYQEIDGSVIPFDDRLYVEKSLENAGFVHSAVRLAS